MIAGYVIWDEVPDGWVVAGAIIIVASGLFVVYRNKRLGRYFAERPHLMFRYQMIQVAGSLLAVLFIILFMPFGQKKGGQMPAVSVICCRSS